MPRPQTKIVPKMPMEDFVSLIELRLELIKRGIDLADSRSAKIKKSWLTHLQTEAASLNSILSMLEEEAK